MDALHVEATTTTTITVTMTTTIIVVATIMTGMLMYPKIVMSLTPRGKSTMKKKTATGPRTGNAVLTTNVLAATIMITTADLAMTMVAIPTMVEVMVEAADLADTAMAERTTAEAVEGRTMVAAANLMALLPPNCTRIWDTTSPRDLVIGTKYSINW